MDVDPGSSTFSALDSHPASFSAEKRLNPADSLTFDQLKISRRNGWPARIKEAQKDESQLSWRGFFVDILVSPLWRHLLRLNHKLIPTPTEDEAETLIGDLTDEEFKELVDGVVKGVNENKWGSLISHPKLQARIPEPASFSRDYASIELLRSAYDAEFVGDGATSFREHLHKLDVDARRPATVIYAKSIAIVQSSGTGKSRMMTEVGKHIFTLPICLRGENDPGYPLSDLPVLEYFKNVPHDNDLSFTAHHRIACFIAAAHTTMLNWLEARSNGNGEQLRAVWHQAMEKNVNDERSEFFSKVVDLAESIQAKNPRETVQQKSPKGGKNRVDPKSSFAPEIERFYRDITQPATKKLMGFISGLFPKNQKTICVTYFDEAHELGVRLWVMLRLLKYQLLNVGMWYVFMGTKSSVMYYSPAPKDHSSLKLRQEVHRLVPPYIALGFDHHLRTRSDKKIKNARMGDLQSIKHLSQYGRPMWRACLLEGDHQDLISLASFKLLNGKTFDSSNADHVFSVLSQRICLEPVVTASEAINLADRSVSHHMRLLTGFSLDHRIFHTHSPSEPLLSLGAINHLYNATPRNVWAGVLDTFSKDLCTPGLVDRGNMGELLARLLLILARDYVVPLEPAGQDLPKPVLILDVMKTLFGNNDWAGENKEKFSNAFSSAYVNYTHWVVTRDSLPEKPDRQLLANLWARGGILQCCHNQSGVDALAAMYLGDVSDEAIFDPALLSGLYLQVKFKVDGDAKAESAMRPVGLPRDLSQPLPYLAILMELGTEAKHQATRSKIKSVAFTLPQQREAFKELVDEWVAAADVLETYRRRPKAIPAETKRLQADVDQKRFAMDSFNRYFVGVRGATAETYGILTTARVKQSFTTLFNVVMEAPDGQANAIQSMTPFDQLRISSPSMAWASEYIKDDDDTEDQEDDEDTEDQEDEEESE